MSRIGKRIIQVPKNVEVQVNKNLVTIKGPLGTLSRQFLKEVAVRTSDQNIEVLKIENTLFAKAFHGTANAIIQNLITGVTKGFKKELIIKGVGYRAKLDGETIILSIGYSHKVHIQIPKGLKVEIVKNTMITVTGIDNVEVGQLAANIRKVRKPSPYSGKGIMYKNEIVRRKEGKTAKS